MLYHNRICLLYQFYCQTFYLTCFDKTYKIHITKVNRNFILYHKKINFIDETSVIVIPYPHDYLYSQALYKII